MLRVWLVSAAILAAQDPAPSPSPSPVGDNQPAPKAEPATPDEARALADYNAIREKTPATAAAQWKLALWCEQNGLRPEAYVHLGKVIELDPKKDLAWQKLGYKKHDGQWMTAAQVAADSEQKKAEKTWLAQLKKCHKDIHGGKKQAEARAALEAITEPAAVSAVYREFGGGGSRDQEIAIQLLGQIESPVASKTLAVLAVYGKSPVVRRVATETLRGRKPEEFLDVLVGLMKDLLRYEVKPVGGPGSPGVLFVEGERFNVRRFYAPPAPPDVSPRPGDSISYDSFGLPVITRATGVIGPMVGVTGSKSLVNEYDPALQFSYSQAMIEAQRAALSAQTQLAGDVTRIETINADRDRFNQLLMGIAKDATGKDPGKTPKDWRESLGARGDRYAGRSQARRIPTLSEVVPPAYIPTFTQATFLIKTVVDS